MIGNRPDGMNVRDWLIQYVSADLGIDKDIVDRVVYHQFDKAREALRDNNSVEISGLGKFLFNQRKAWFYRIGFFLRHERLSKRLEDGIDNEEHKTLVQYQLGRTIADISLLTKKMEGFDESVMQKHIDNLNDRKKEIFEKWSK